MSTDPITTYYQIGSYIQLTPFSTSTTFQAQHRRADKQ